MFEVTIPMVLPSCANLREHWRARAKRTQGQRLEAHYHALAAYKVKVDEAIPPTGLVVTLHRIGKRKLDDDNLQSAFKAVRDGVADALGIKDNDPRVSWQYSQSTARIPGITLRFEARS